MSTRRPKLDTTIDGVRLRVYAGRSEYEVLCGDGDISDPEAAVWLFPKVGDPEVWARQALANYQANG